MIQCLQWKELYMFLSNVNFFVVSVSMVSSVTSWNIFFVVFIINLSFILKYIAKCVFFKGYIFERLLNMSFSMPIHISKDYYNFFYVYQGVMWNWNLNRDIQYLIVSKDNLHKCLTHTLITSSSLPHFIQTV